MEIQPLRFRIVGVAAVARALKFERSLCTAINGAGMTAHPFAHPGKSVIRAFVKFSTPGRTYVQKQVAAHGYAVDKHLEQLIHALPCFFVAIVPP